MRHRFALVALAAGILVGPRIASGVFIGQLLFALSRGQSLEPALAIAVGNSLEVVIGALLARRWGIGPRLDPSGYVRLIALIFLILQPFSATLGTAALWFWGSITSVEDVRQVWLSWWSGNGLAQLLLVPLLLAIFTESWSKFRRDAPKIAVPVALLVPALGFAFFSPVAQHQTTALLLPCAPLLLWIAGRGGIAPASLITTALVMALLFLTGQGYGPFLREGTTLVFDLNAYSLGLAMMIQVFSLLDAERQRLEVERHALVDQLRISASVFASTQDGVLIAKGEIERHQTTALFLDQLAERRGPVLRVLDKFREAGSGVVG